MTHRLIIRPEAEAELAEADAITVVGVFHGARDPRRWQKRS